MAGTEPFGQKHSSTHQGMKVLDLFAGTSRVGSAFKKNGGEVWANDLMAYAWTVATCYVQADKKKWLAEAQEKINALNAVKPKAGWFTKTFCEDARYVHPTNGAKVDAMRETIEGWNLAPELKAILLTSLMEACDKVDSTTGVQMAYLKSWAKRAHNPIVLHVPDLIEKKGHALHMNAVDCVKKYKGFDVAYLDPPYNQHSYLGNYHMWQSLVLWDKPEVYGVANKRIDCKTVKSKFNSKVSIHDEMAAVVEHLDAKLMVVSFSNEGFISLEAMTALLRNKGHVSVAALPFKRYIGATIGVYNPQGEKVGSPTHVTNHEYLFFVSEDEKLAEACKKSALDFYTSSL